LVSAVEAGLGFSILPSCGIEEAVRTKRLEAVPLEEGRLVRTVYLSTSRMFALSRAAEHVNAIVERMIENAVLQGRWRAQIIATACPSRPR
jgi:DNA-binding transcriptional LysR family regulator